MKRYYSQWRLYPFALIVILGLSTACQWTPPGKPEGQLLVILSRWGRVGERYELIDLRGRRSDISRNLGVTGMPRRPAQWSPAGDRLAYICGVADDDRFWIFDVDFATLTASKYPLPSGEDAHPAGDLTWSVDGMSFLFIWGGLSPSPGKSGGSTVSLAR